MNWTFAHARSCLALALWGTAGFAIAQIPISDPPADGSPEAPPQVIAPVPLDAPGGEVIVDDTTLDVPSLSPEFQGEPRQTPTVYIDYGDGDDFIYGPEFYEAGRPAWLRNISIFGGIHGFKGPPDMGRNGNFGVHEGVNYTVPSGFFESVAYQVGVSGVHSNFSGSEPIPFVNRRSDRNQLFLTAGFFKRARGNGFQGGTALDLMHDTYYYDDRATLQQIRSETGYVLGDNEIGYWGAYSLDSQTVTTKLANPMKMRATDMFAFFFRRYFENDADGRVWGGFTGNGDGLFGAELRVPITGGWALENRINYLIPKGGRPAGSIPKESWGLAIQLVWHPFQSARRASRDRYRPMLTVADNAMFMTDFL